MARPRSRLRHPTSKKKSRVIAMPSSRSSFVRMTKEQVSFDSISPCCRRTLTTDIKSSPSLRGSAVLPRPRASRAHPPRPNGRRLSYRIKSFSPHVYPTLPFRSTSFVTSAVSHSRRSQAATPRRHTSPCARSHSRSRRSRASTTLPPAQQQQRGVQRTSATTSAFWASCAIAWGGARTAAIRRAVSVASTTVVVAARRL